MAENKGFKGLEDQKNEETDQAHSSGQASFSLVITRQIIEAARLLSTNNMDTNNKLIEIIETLTKILEEQEEMKAKSRPSFNWRKIKRKRKMAYYYCIKSESQLEIYKECFNKNEITLPKHHIPKCRKDETTEEYELRLKIKKQNLKQEAEILKLRSRNYKEKVNALDIQVRNFIESTYNQNETKMKFIKNKWEIDCKKEELKSRQILQSQETIWRLQIRTFKTPASAIKSYDKRNKHTTNDCETHLKLTKQNQDVDTEKQNTSEEQTLLANLKKLEHEYMNEMGKMIHAQDSKLYFDDARLKKVGIEINEIELRLYNNSFKAKQVSHNYMINSSIIRNMYQASKHSEKIISTRLKSQIPVPIRKKKIELRLHNNNLEAIQVSHNYIPNSSIIRNVYKASKHNEKIINTRIKSQIPVPIRKKNKVRYKLTFDIK